MTESNEPIQPQNNNYDSSKITVLRGLEAVRKRPGMYIGDVHDGTGLHHMVFEVVDNGIDEALAGHCDRLVVTLHVDGSVSVSDNGRGIPVDIHKEEGVSAAEVIMTVLHAGGKFDDNSYKVSGGLHGVGVSVVNALSSHLWLDIWRDGHHHRQEYSLGEPLYPLKTLGASNKRGTELRFSAERGNLHRRRVPLRHPGQAPARAQLPQLRRAHRADRRARRRQARRLRVRRRHQELRRAPGRAEDAAAPNVISASGEKDGIVVDIAVQWTDAYQETMFCFTNNIPQKDGGTHLIGFRAALTRTLSNYIEQNGIARQAKIALSATTCAKA
jgi:DNA gyrase subunit B